MGGDTGNAAHPVVSSCTPKTRPTPEGSGTTRGSARTRPRFEPMRFLGFMRLSRKGLQRCLTAGGSRLLSNGTSDTYLCTKVPELISTDSTSSVPSLCLLYD